MMDTDENIQPSVDTSADGTENIATPQTETSVGSSLASTPLKQPTTFEQQIELFKSRGLIIKDERYALNVLQRINYYRLTSYCLSYKKDDKYCEGTTFDDIISLYEFDKKLRHSLLDIIECVEIAFRTHIAYHLAHKYGALSYSDKQYFRSERYHTEFMEELNKEIDRSSEVFVEHHRRKYNGQFPIWVTTEMISIGCLSKFYGNMLAVDKKAISIKYYNAAFSFVESWLASIAYIRNICAHHSRLYNRSISKPPKMLIVDKLKGINEYSLFPVIYNLKYLVLDRPKWDYFVAEIAAMIESYPAVNIQRMGFPVNWKGLLLSQ